MATEPQKPTPAVSPEVIEEIFGTDPAKTASMQGIRTDTTGLPRETALDQAAKPEPIILDGYTLYVELYDNRTHERGSQSEQLTIVDLGDNPALVKLAGTLAEAAHENLKSLD